MPKIRKIRQIPVSITANRLATKLIAEMQQKGEMKIGLTIHHLDISESFGLVTTIIHMSAGPAVEMQFERATYQ